MGRIVRNQWGETWSDRAAPVPGFPPKPWEDRFWPRVNKTDTCWLWTGGTAGKYGTFRMPGGIKVYVHRFICEQVVGPIPEGLEIDHTCRVHLCVRPDHLEAVTHKENMRRWIYA